ncbi:lysozyme [Patescibacteria group bacterium]|nr:lysozyme [Patescibacteria group bacterium]
MYIVDYNSFINEQNEQELLESINFKTLVKDLHFSKNKKRAAKALVIGLLTIYPATKADSIINTNTTLTSFEKSIVKDEISEIQKDVKDPQTLTISKDGLEHIKHYESFRSDAYKICDGMITIGYGHAEPESKSTYQVGDTITKVEADKLFKQDVDVAEAGVKRMFKQWAAKGFKLNVTQKQFDVFVSLAYNMGVQGLRNSDFMQTFKHGDVDAATEKLKTLGINDRFPGLAKRRDIEHKLFSEV